VTIAILPASAVGIKGDSGVADAMISEVGWREGEGCGVVVCAYDVGGGELGSQSVD
jgi:hypothetical protein